MRSKTIDTKNINLYQKKSCSQRDKSVRLNVLFSRSGRFLWHKRSKLAATRHARAINPQFLRPRSMRRGDGDKWQQIGEGDSGIAISFN
jgi:hypothetical protein